MATKSRSTARDTKPRKALKWQKEKQRVPQVIDTLPEEDEREEFDPMCPPTDFDDPDVGLWWAMNDPRDK